MGSSFRPFGAALIALWVSGCSSALVDDVKSEMVRTMRNGGRSDIPPGLEPLYNRQADTMPVVPVMGGPDLPQPLDPAMLPFPVGSMPADMAQQILAGDPAALRFLAVKVLTGQGLLPPDQVLQRRQTNLGALLPLTTEQAPAVGLDAPIPPLGELTQRLVQLYDPASRGTDDTRRGERTFMADGLLPAQPKARQRLAPPDVPSARKHQDRLRRLEDAGLISALEYQREMDAVDAQIASGDIPASLAPPPAPPKPKKKVAGPKRPGQQRMPGGVHGGLEVIPSPPGVDAPKVPSGQSGPVGLHLLSMGSAAHGDKAWDTLKKDFPELAEMSFKVSKADLGDLGVTYRLIAGPVDGAKGDQLCTVLKAKGQSCQTTPFPQ